MSVVSIRKVKPDEAEMRLDRWFKQHFPDLAFGHLQKLLRTGQVRVEGKRAKSDTRLAPGQTIRIPPLDKDANPRADAREAGARGEATPRERASTGPGAAENARPRSLKEAKRESETAAYLKSITLYEDDEMMVLNKPAGLAVQGGSGTVRHVDGMLDALKERDGQRPRLVHRLDKDTAGCLIIAKTRLSAAALAKSFRSRSARKVYWALVAGVPRVKQGRISTYLAKGEDEHGDAKMKVAKHGDEGADHAVTYYAVVDTMAQKLAWLSLKPVTGRTHQLRAHTAHMRHPIVGDPKYFDVQNWELPGGMQNKLHLLARRIAIPHPKTGKIVDVTAPLPPHMQQSWNLLGFDTKGYDPIEDAPE
ncbi:MAG: RluA family pseudouridine synthase [Proteobacteria bacterium]|nr:RluA family pseudouridine synthase [Pseudomonadota bacterium]